MVTPVHRFQAIESVAVNGLRLHHHAPPGGGQRNTSRSRPSNTPYNSPRRNLRYTTSNGSCTASGGSLSQNSISHGLPNHAPTGRLKCGVWFVFGMAIFFLTTSKYYFHGVHIGIEAVTFCSLLVVILIVGGLLSLYETVTGRSTAHQSHTDQVQHRDANGIVVTTFTDVPNAENAQIHNGTATSASTMPPPPPYHIAVMLPAVNRESIHRESPPPTYDKAVDII